MEAVDNTDYGAIAQQAVKRLKELHESKAWIDNGDKGCKMYKCEIGNRIASKGVAKVAYNIEKIVAFLRNEESLKKISSMLKEVKVLKIKEGEGAYRINYMLYAGIWPVDDRDFVSVSG